MTCHSPGDVQTTLTAVQLNEGAHLLLDQVTLQFNQARDGAAISSMSDAGLTGSLTVTHSSFLDNRFSSLFAGGIVTDQPTVIQDSSFIRNGNDLSLAAVGGALAFFATDATIIRTRFDDNNAGSSGGAIYAINGVPNATSTTTSPFGRCHPRRLGRSTSSTHFHRNQARPQPLAPAHWLVTVTIRRSLFNANSAGGGGNLQRKNTTIYQQLLPTRSSTTAPLRWRHRHNRFLGRQSTAYRHFAQHLCWQQCG